MAAWSAPFKTPVSDGAVHDRLISPSPLPVAAVRPVGASADSSSSVIIPIAVPSVTLGVPDMGLRVTVKVSSCSSTASWTVSTVKVLAVSDAANDTRPEVVVPRSAMAAVSDSPMDVVQFSETDPVPVLVTVKDRLPALCAHSIGD